MSFDLSDYVDVPERIAEFRTKYPDGSLQPAVVERPFEVVEVAGKTFIAYSAAAYRTPDDPRPGIGTAWEPFPGTTPYTRDSELQNAETSAWGRAIVAVLAADTKRGIASATEVRNRQASDKPSNKRAPAQNQNADAPSEKQLALAKKVATELGDVALVRSIIEEHAGREAKLADLSKREISAVIDALKEASVQKEASAQAAHTAQQEKAAENAASGAEPFDLRPGEEPFD